MPRLSVVIVNYNVKHFLEQCLHSVQKASEQVATEIFVVDNNSVDGSCGMVQEKFPQVSLLENSDNKGFSIANNQAIRKAQGDYILLLNPDTVVEEDTFSKIVAYMDAHPEAGGLGVKMIDGKGRFLPESKRGLPEPKVAFYKIFGLSGLFPKSRRFGRYHLSFLDKEQEHEVDVLSGAFMLLRKEALDKAGLLDEDFFMYGEDIDMSYRIQQAGYKNIYYPGTTIIHYKGESTKKGSVNYVLVFYNAMIIFARKHFSAKNARLLYGLIKMAVYFRAFIALLSRVFSRIYLPVLDAGLIFAGFYLLKPLWEQFKFGNSGIYPAEFMKFVVPGYIFIWLVCIFLSGGYDRPLKLWRLLRGILVGALVILAAYSLLPESWRFSRALILLGSAWTLMLVPFIRFIGHISGVPGMKLWLKRKKRIVLIGSRSEIEKLNTLLEQTGIDPRVVGYVSPGTGKQEGYYYIGSMHQLEEIIKIHKVDEMIFCARDISSQEIISSMLRLENVNVDYKIASPDGISVIGSNSIHTAGDLYTIEINSISNAANRRKKRIADVGFALVFLPLLPVMWLITGRPGRFTKNWLLVLLGLRSWVGYDSGAPDDAALPQIKKGILHPASAQDITRLSPEKRAKLNLLYAKDYKLANDISIILKGLKKLGR